MQLCTYTLPTLNVAIAIAIYSIDTVIRWWGAIAKSKFRQNIILRSVWDQTTNFSSYTVFILLLHVSVRQWVELGLWVIFTLGSILLFVLWNTNGEPYRCKNDSLQCRKYYCRVERCRNGALYVNRHSHAITALIFLTFVLCWILKTQEITPQVVKSLLLYWVKQMFTYHTCTSSP